MKTNHKNYIASRYQQIVSHLYIRKEIAVYPKYAATTSKRFYGRIRRNGIEDQYTYKDIRISNNVFEELARRDGETKMKAKLDETICHELAHMIHWNHKPEHGAETQRLLSIIKSLPKLENPEVDKVASAAEVIVSSTGTVIKLSDICSNPTQARAALRKAGIKKPGTKWEWKVVPAEVQKIVGLL